MKLSASRALLVAGVVLCGVLVLKGSSLLVPSGNWAPEGTMATARLSASAALLADGRILITGGDPGAGAVTTADFFNTDGTISSAPAMSNARSHHIAVTLKDGRVLVAGGITAGGSTTSTVEIFDPIINSWTAMGVGMVEARSGATAALLSDGRVLVAGGQNGSSISSTLEVFDPALGAFTPAGMMSSPRTQHAMAAMQDGRVLIVGGFNGSIPVASTDIFDSVTGMVSAGPNLSVARFGHSATTLLNGQVVVIGGNNGNVNPAQMDTTPAETVDFTVATPAFTTLATNLATPREGHLAVLLPNNNNILIAGGTSAGTLVASTELFAPQESSQGVWTFGFGATGALTTARSSMAVSANQLNVPSSTMQRNGVVMIAGGNDASGNALNTTEAYGYPTVQTDQSDYPPGTTVTITGSGFQPNETITIQLVESPLIDTHGPYTVQAGANGNFVDTSFTTDEHDVDVRFFLRVMGGTSGFVAQNTFTDNKTVSIAFAGTGSGNVTSSGGSGTLNCTSTGGSSSGTCSSNSFGNTDTVTLTATPASPSTIGPWTVPAYTIVSGCTSGSATCKFTMNNTSQTITVIFSPGPASATNSTATASPASVIADGSTASTVTVTLKDSGGNVVSGKTVTLTAGSGSSTITAVNGTTNASGQATFTVKDTTVESVTYTAMDMTDNVTVTQTATVNFTVGPVSATASTVSASPTSVIADGSTISTISVTLFDSFSRPVSGKTVTLTAGSGSSTITTLNGTTNASGQASFTVKDTKAETVTYTAKDTTDTITITQTASVTFTPGPVSATKSTVTANPTSVIADGSTTSTITVTLLDATSNPVSGKAVTLSQGAGSSTISAASGSSNTSGVVTFTVKDTKAETVTYTATDSTDSTAITQTASVTFTAGNPSAAKSTVSASPTSVPADGSTTSTITVTLLDVNSNPVSGKTVTLSQGTGSSTISLASGASSASGVVTFTMKDTKAETVTYTATDSTDSVIITQTATVTYTVGAVSPTTSTVSASPASVVADGSTTSTITVTLKDANNNPVSGKAVSLSEGSGSSTITTVSGTTNASGQATFTVKDAVVESITYAAKDTSDSITLTQTATVNFTVGAVSASASTVSANPTSLTADGVTTSTITVTLMDSFSHPVSGKTVSLTAGSGSSTITTVSGTTNASGQATFTVKDTKVETVTYTEKDSTDNITIAQTASVTFTVGTVNAGKSTVSASPASVTADGTTTSTVTVTLNDANSNPVSGKTVTLSQGTGSSTISAASGASNASGVVTFTVKDTKAEPVTYTATDSTDNITITQTASVTFTVGPLARFVFANISSQTVGTPFNVTITAEDASGNTVTTYSGDGNQVILTLSSGTLVSSPVGVMFSNGVGNQSVTITTAGTTTIIATGNPGHASGITGTSGMFTVNQATTSTTVISSANPSVFGQSVTFTATVTDSSAGSTGTPTGTVTFKDGTNTLGTGTLSASSPDTATFTTSTLSLSSHSITAVYGGDTNFTGSTSGALTQTVNQATTTTTAAVSPNSITFGQSTTVTATVTPQIAGTPTGTVSVSDGLGKTGDTCSITLSSGTGQCTLTPSSNGNLTVTASYGDDANFKSSSGTASLTVTGTPPSITSGASAMSTAGMAGSFTVTTSGTPTPSLGDGGAMLPGGVTFNDNGNGTATLAWTTAATLAGTYHFTITATNGVGNPATQNFTLTVNPAALASITLSPASATITAGGSAPYTAAGYDQYGNSLGDVTGATTFTVTNGTCTMNSCSSTVAGTQTVTGSDSGKTATATLVVNPGTITALMLNPATASSGAGGSQTYTAQGVDLYGNPASDVTSSTTFTIAPDGSCGNPNPANSCTANVADANGSSHTVTGTYTNGAKGTASLTITAGSFTQLQLLVPGETAAPGTATGKTGTPNTEYVNGAFNVTANAVDQYWNLVDTVTDTVQITSNDSKAKLPSNAGLVAGTGTFSVALETVSYNPATTTITASDVTDGTKTATRSPVIPVIVVYTATITPTMTGTGVQTTYTLTVNNFAAPNTNTLRGVTVAVPQFGGTPSNVTVTASQADSTPANWTVDLTHLPGAMLFTQSAATDGVGPGGNISIQVTATATNSISGATTQNVWPTTAYSDAYYTTALPLAWTDPNVPGSEPTVMIGQAPAITSANSTNAFIYSAPNTTFTVVSTGTPTPTLTESGSFPSWATFKDNGDGTATISGTPTAAGTSTFTIMAHNGFGIDATQTFSLIVQKADAMINVTTYNVTYNGNPHTATGTATGVKGEDLSSELDLSHTTHTSAGTYSSDYWTFTDTTGNYNNVATTTITDCIKKANTAISVTPYNVTYDGNPHTAMGTATGVKGEDLNSELDLSHTTHTNAGTYGTDYWTFTDTTGNYNNVAATTVTDCIKKANAAISVTPYNVTYDGNPHTAMGTATGVKGEDLINELDLSHTTHTTASTYSTDYWAFTDTTGNYNNVATTTITDYIKKANAVIMVTPYSVTYDGNPHTATGTATGVESPMPANLSSGLNLSATTHTDAGTYGTDYWTFIDTTGNYNNVAATTITDSIARASSMTTVTFESGPYVYRGTAFTASAQVVGVGALASSVGAVYSGDCANVTATNGCTATATFAGDTNHFGSTDSKSITITQASSMTAVTFEVGPYTYRGTAFTATAAVTGVGGLNQAVPVVYSGDCGNVTTPSGCTATATFTGDTNHTGSTDHKSITITQASSMTSVMFEGGPYIYRGTPFMATAAVTGVGGLNQAVSVVYSGDCTNVSGSNGCTAMATFAGDANHTGSSGMISITITQAPTATAASSSPNPSNWGNVVTLTATVANTSTIAAPSGFVSFYNAASGANCSSLGTSTLLDTVQLTTIGASQQASTSTPNLPVGPGNTVGTDAILACYNNNPADPNYNANFVASNGTTTQTVNPAPIATLVPSSLSFGGQQGGTTSGAQTVTICNGPSGAAGSPCFNAPVSTAALVISNIGFTSPNTNPVYFNQTSTCPIGGTGVPVGGSCASNVKFAPPLNAQGIATAFLTVTDNNENVAGSAQSASLVGAGTSAVTGVGSLSTYAIFGTANGCSSVNVSGNGTVDSLGNSNSSGNVGTNGNVTLSGNPVVNGAVYSPLGGTGNCSTKTMTGLSMSGKAQATGGLQALSGPVNYPLPPAPNPPTTTQNISGSCGSIISCSNAGTKAVVLAPGQYGNLNISGGTTVNISGGTYNINSLTLSGNSILVVTPNTGPVVVNLAGKSLSGGNAALDLSGGSMSNPSGMASNLQFYYAGSQPMKLSGGTGSYAVVYAPNAPINVSGGSHFYGSIIGSTVNSSGNTAIHYPTSLPSIGSGSIWFSSTGLTVKGLPNTGSVKLYVTNASINFMAGGTTYNLPVPNAVITFSSTATSASTTWDPTNNRWSTLVPMSSVNGNATIHTFLDGVAFQVPPGGFPTGMQNVTWQAAYSTSTTGLSFNWQWGAAVYSSLPAASATGNYSSFGVNSQDNSVPAGTPVNYEGNLIFGDTGAGYTGLYANFVGVVPTIAPMNVAPSSYDFGGVSQGGTATANVPFVLTNNDSVPYTISSIQMTGTYAGDFVQTNNCPISPNTLGAGASCTFTVNFTPSTSGGTKETVKIVINDNANNSPQTVFLKGAGQ